jgi:hypothetical protein
MRIKNLTLMLAIAFSAVAAHASTQVIFSRDGQKATVLLPSISGNPDSAALYDALNVPEQEDSGKLTKKFALTGADGERLLETACVFSKLVKGHGSCAIVLHAASGVVFNPARSQAGLEVRGETAARFAAFFYVAAHPDGLLYQSSDGALIIRFVPDGHGGAEAMSLTYN